MDNENKKIITKSVNTVRNEFYSAMGGIGYVEILLFCIFVIIAMTFSVLVKNLFIFLPVDFLLFISFAILIAPAPSTKGKVYNYLQKIFKYIFQKQKFKKVNENNKNFCPLTVDKNGKIIIFNSKQNFNKHIVIYEIIGFDFSLMTSEEFNDCVDNFSQFLKNINLDVKLIKIEKSFNLENQIKYLKELSKYWEKQYLKKLINEQTYVKIFEQLTEQVNIDISIEKENEFKRMCFYLVVSGDNIKEIQEIVGLNQQYLKTANLSFEKITNNVEINEIFKQLYLPYNNKQNIFNIIENSKIEFHKNYYKINDTFFSISNVLTYPYFVNNGWLGNLSKLEQTNLIFNVIDLDKNQAIKMLDNGYIKVQMNSFNAKKISEDVDYENYAESFKELIYRIKNDNEVIKFTQLSFITYSSNLDELKNINNKLFTVINQNNMILDKLSYKQQDSLLNLWINYNDKNKINYNEMSTNSIASCFPFLNNNLLDNNGFYLGQTAIGVPCFLDIKIRDKKKRNNNNVFVVGKSGTGKSFNIKKQLNWLYLNKTKIYIIDPEREFCGFSIFYNAKIIDCGNAKTGLINPLQVFHFFDEDETQQQENELKGHIRSLEEWFKLIFNNLNTNDVLIAMLEEMLFLTYKNHKITTLTKLKNIKNNQWPTLQNLYENALNKFKDSKYENDQQLLSYLKQLSNEGAYGELWNGYTTLDVKDDKFIIFDIYNLRKNRQIINAQQYLMLQFLENEVIKNKNKNAKLPIEQQEWICIAVDEAHLLINKQNLIALQFLYEMVKRIRKYNGIMYVITQNINDFVGSDEIKREAEAILNNCDYQFVHHLADKDLQDYNSIVQGGLNNDELNSIKKADQGECLLTIGSNKRTFLSIEATEEEKNAWENKEW